MKRLVPRARNLKHTTVCLSSLQQGWNFCIFGDPGSEPKKIKEPKKTRSKTRGKGRKRKRGGEKEKRG